ncbi:hypothetical protein HDU93_009339, partial [Gonapodya sp. JEL0774]
MSSKGRIVSHQVGASQINAIVVAKDEALFVGAADKSVKCLAAGTMNEIAAIQHHRAAVNSLSLHNHFLFSASSDWTAAVFNVENVGSGPITLDKELVRLTMPVVWAAVAPDGKKVAIASDLLDIKLLQTSSITSIRLLRGHTKPPRCVAWDPAGDYLISAGADGVVRCWDCREDPPSEVAVLKDQVAILNPDALDRLQIAWHPAGKYFAVPGPLNDIAVIENETWQTLFHLGEHGGGRLSLLSISPSGTHLAAVSLDSLVAVWDLKSKLVVSRHKHPCRVTALAWIGDKVVWGDVQGTVAVWSAELKLLKAVEERKVGLDELAKSLFDDEALEKKKSSLGGEAKEKHSSGGDLGNSLSDADDAEVGENAEEDDDDLNDEFVEDDDGAGYAEYGFEPEGARRGGQHKHRPRPKVGAGTARSVLSNADYDLPYHTECQPPIQPGSTPLQSSGSAKGAPRYLAFNLTGFVYSVDQNTHSTVHVEFHDHYNFTMGSIAERGAIFACPSSQGNPSTVVYRPFESWATKGDWTVQMGPSENVVGICLTTKGAVVGTDQRYLRFFSFSGVQISIMSVWGPIVSMASFEDQLLVIAHQGAAYHGDQNLAYALYNVSTMECLRKDALPISPASQLTWVGFAENT